MLSGKASVHERNVFTTVYDTIVFFISIYNQVHSVTNRIGLILFSFQTL